MAHTDIQFRAIKKSIFPRTRSRLSLGFVALALFTLLISRGAPPSAYAAGEVDVTPAPQVTTGTEGDGKYQFLAPISALKLDNVVDLKDKGFDNYLKAIFNFLIGVIGVLGVVRLVMAGVSLFTNPGNASGIAKARGEVTNIIVSFLLIGGSFIFLNTINPQFVSEGLLLNPIHMNVKYTLDQALGKTYDIPPGGDTSDMSTSEALDSSAGLKPGWYILIDKEKVNGKEQKVRKFVLGSETDSGVCGDMAKQISEAYDKGTTEQHADTSTFSKNCFHKEVFPQSEDEAQIRKEFSDAGVPVNKAACTPTNHSSCTSVGGYTDNNVKYGPLSGDTVGKIAALAGANAQSLSNCPRLGNPGCVVVVTGGTEHWQHQTHGNPNTFDLSRTPALASFIFSHASIQAPSFPIDGVVRPRYFYDDMWFTDENSAHFHVCTTASQRAECKDPTVAFFTITTDRSMSANERARRGIYLTGDNVKIYGKGSQ